MRNFDDLASQKLSEMRTKEQLTKPVMKTKVWYRFFYIKHSNIIIFFYSHFPDRSTEKS